MGPHRQIWGPALLGTLKWLSDKRARCRAAPTLARIGLQERGFDKHRSNRHCFMWRSRILSVNWFSWHRCSRNTEPCEANSGRILGATLCGPQAVFPPPPPSSTLKRASAPQTYARHDREIGSPALRPPGSMTGSSPTLCSNGQYLCARGASRATYPRSAKLCRRGSSAKSFRPPAAPRRATRSAGAAGANRPGAPARAKAPATREDIRCSVLARARAGRTQGAADSTLGARPGGARMLSWGMFAGTTRCGYMLGANSL